MGEASEPDWENLPDGVVRLDASGRVVSTNSVFAKIVGIPQRELTGRLLSDLPYRVVSDSCEAEPLPWVEALRSGRSLSGRLLARTSNGHEQTLHVSTSPVLQDGKPNGGVLVSVHDVTALCRQQVQLMQLLSAVRESSAEIRRQNRELERLAHHDPLTGCFNRRSFLEQFDTLWKAARRRNEPLACVLVDIDHFKPINDNHGHAVGDRVLRAFAEALRAEARESDVVCRYGGEEFAILLPHTGLAEAVAAAERFRAAVSATRFSGLRVTASFGVSATSLGAFDPEQLVDQSDRSLYFAKRSGRNRVVRYDEIPADFVFDSAITPVDSTDRAEECFLPLPAVTALLAALSYRDAQTAEHCRRVAELCVAVADGLLPHAAGRLVETAALLHDIGKIGVPDSILLKPGPLTEDEWQVMRRHQRIGVEIIRASFTCPELTEILESFGANYAGTPDARHLPCRDAIPLAARVLAVADAYDAIVNGSVFRPGRSREEALAELRRCAGTQFDPAIVERFCEVVRVRQFGDATPTTGLPSGTMLDIGRQVEALITAFDRRDVSGLRALAGRLKDMASRYGIAAIAEKAGELEQTSEPDADLTHILQTAHDLIGLCRSAHRPVPEPQT